MLAAVVISGPAGAQTDASTVGRPLLLAPVLRDTVREGAPAQIPASPAAAAPGAPAGASSSLGPSPLPGLKSPVLKSPASVQVDRLRLIDADAAGVLGESQGGLGAGMWQGTSRVVVEALLPQLPVHSASPTMRDLMRRLLLSTAAAPEGEPGETSLMALRVGRLAAMGDIAGVNELLNAAPARTQNEALIRMEADSRFLTSDNARACTLASAQIVAKPTPYWQKAFIFCQALAGQHAQAALGVSLLRELGEKDPAFFSLIDAVATGAKPAIASMADPAPLHLAMARVVKAQLPADILSSGNPGILRTIAISPNAPVELRLEAAERAEAAGALAVDDLRQLYTSFPFSADDLANPLSKAEAEAGALSRALLYRTALVQTVPTAQAEAAGLALDLGRAGGRYVSTVRAFLPVLRRVPATSELAWFAPDVIRAFLASGQGGSAQAWFDVLRNDAKSDERSAAHLARLLPLARLADAADTVGWDDGSLMAWWDAERKEEGAHERAARLYMLFESLGEPVPPPLWEVLLEGPQRGTVVMPRPAHWHRLENAAEEGRRGETVLLALLALGDGGPGRANPIVLYRVIGALRAVGLDAEARALAVEAALAAGL